jgi:hypothetical protein
MTNAKRKLLALAMGFFVCAGAFAQKGGGGRGEDRRPPKNPDTKVVVKEKEKPPSNNNNQRGNRGNDGKRGRP